MKRIAEIKRKTAETDIELKLNVDGVGISDISTGIGFLDHMLTLFARHACFDLTVRANGDTGVDFHHTTEDVGICLGKALTEALGDMAGIRRYADVTLPMDEALVLCAIDVSGRNYLAFNAEIPNQKIGDFDSELIEEFFAAFTRNCPLTLHIKKLDGRNSHHIAECIFKAFAHALSSAVAPDPANAGRVLSTKGVL